jgi:hypothetical protein
MKLIALLSVVVCLVATTAAAKPVRASGTPPPTGRAEAPANGGVSRPVRLGGPEPQAAKHFAEILVLHATNEKKGIDRRIGEMPELTKPPFSSYDSYALVERGRLPLEKGVPKTLTLPNGRVLEAKLLEVLAGGSVRLSASINQPGGKEFLPLLEVKAKIGQPFIVAGQSYKRGILVLVIRVVR